MGIEDPSLSLLTVQAYLACDKNEALAANLLLNDMGAGMQPAFQAPAATPAPVAATASSEAPAPASTTDSGSAPAATSDESASPEAPADGQTGEGGGDEDEDMYG